MRAVARATWGYQLADFGTSISSAILGRRASAIVSAICKLWRSASPVQKFFGSAFSSILAPSAMCASAPPRPCSMIVFVCLAIVPAGLAIAARSRLGTCANTFSIFLALSRLAEARVWRDWRAPGRGGSVSGGHP